MPYMRFPGRKLRVTFRRKQQRMMLARLVVDFLPPLTDSRLMTRRDATVAVPFSKSASRSLSGARLPGPGPHRRRGDAPRHVAIRPRENAPIPLPQAVARVNWPVVRALIHGHTETGKSKPGEGSRGARPLSVPGGVSRALGGNDGDGDGDRRRACQPHPPGRVSRRLQARPGERRVPPARAIA